MSEEAPRSAPMEEQELRLTASAAQPAAALDPRIWDGFTLSYAPREKLNISPRLRLHTETAAEIDPIAFEVIRNALWILNEEHADTIRKVGASPVASFANDLNTSIQTETGEAVMFAPYVQYFAGVADLVCNGRWRTAAKTPVSRKATSSSRTTRWSASAIRWTCRPLRRCSSTARCS